MVIRFLFGSGSTEGPCYLQSHSSTTRTHVKLPRARLRSALYVDFDVDPGGVLPTLPLWDWWELVREGLTINLSTSSLRSSRVYVDFWYT